MIMKIGLQLYSAKELTEKDFFGTLEQVAKIGYQGVEFAGYFGTDPVTLKQKLEELGLAAAASHLMLNEPQKPVDFEKKLGNRCLIHPHYSINCVEDVEAAVKMLSAARDYLLPLGFEIGYHNHAHEFTKYGDKCALDTIFESIPELICELDVFWAAYAKTDPAEYLRKYSGRIPIIHIKDLNSNGKSTEVGSGLLDIKSIVQAARDGKTEWLIVEQEDFEKYPVMDSLRISYEFLNDLINADTL